MPIVHDSFLDDKSIGIFTAVSPKTGGTYDLPCFGLGEKNKKFSKVGCEKTGANFVNMFIILIESCRFIVALRGLYSRKA